MKIITFISIYILKNVSNNFMMQEIKSKLKCFRSQQTNNKEWNNKIFMTAHILLLHQFDVYIYTNFIDAIYSRVDIKH